MRGSSLLEVLVAIVILSVGLLGLAGLQARSQQAEGESYERAQAITVLKDMTDRMTVNKTNLDAYVGADYGSGSDTDCSGIASTAVVERDLCEWDLSLRGAAAESAGQKIGIMRLARGCITTVASGTATGSGTMVEVAWYAQSTGTAPPAELTCGQGLDPDDRKRRVVSEVVETANLGT